MLDSHIKIFSMSDENDKFFYFSNGTKRFGPYSRQQVLNLIFQNRVGIMDLVFDSRSQEWTKLMNHVDFEMDESDKSQFVIGLAPEIKTTNTDFMQQLTNITSKPKAGAGAPPVIGGPPPIENASAPKPASPLMPKIEAHESSGATSVSGLTLAIPQNASETKSWYMKEGAITLGPYHYLTIISMIQDGTLRDTDLLRQKGEKDWKAVSEIFSKEDRDQVGSLIPQAIQATAPDRANLRKDIRRDINRVLLVSDDKVQYVVQGLDISLGGISFASLAPHFTVGQILTCTLTHTTKDIVNVKGKVVRVQPIKSSNDEIELLKYVLIFDEKIDPSLVTTDE